jgi:hypothetical protein
MTSTGSNPSNLGRIDSGVWLDADSTRNSSISRSKEFIFFMIYGSDMKNGYCSMLNATNTCLARIAQMIRCAQPGCHSWNR